MPRGNRFHLPGYVWHITDRCHRQQFLLKFARDRRAWIRWLYEARKRFGLCALGYQVTHNHIHLVVRDRGHGEIANSMQLVEGCVARAYNRRKSRRGAFWQECYNATAVDSDEHLANCLTYVDLNMVRAGVVAHPSAWPDSSYHEIQRSKQRFRIVDRDALCELLGVAEARLARVQNEWIDAKLEGSGLQREALWSDSIAVGRRSFVEGVRDQLGSRARYRQINDCNGVAVLREAGTNYGVHPGVEIAAPSRL
jgi:putative transposase